MPEETAAYQVYEHRGKPLNLLVCQPSVEGYSFLSLIRASSVVNRQWTVARC